MFFVGLFLIGFLSGQLACLLACWLLLAPPSETASAHGLLQCNKCGQRISLRISIFRTLLPWRCGQCGSRGPLWPLLTSISAGALFLLFGWSLELGCQTVTEVRPSAELWQQRLPYHLLFVFLLMVATITDLLEYVIPDLVVFAGILLAVLLATISGDLQIIHIWVDWGLEDLYGPYLPEWMKHHRHLHGLLWSLTGMLAGASLMWIVRLLAGSILGYPAVGLGDVTLMAMIGAFVGWQPVLCVLAIAPLSGLVIGLLVKLISGRHFLALGPWLAFAAVVVLFSWQFLWVGLGLRTIFSHWPTVAGLVAGSLASLALLLGGLRVFRSIPTDAIR